MSKIPNPPPTPSLSREGALRARTACIVPHNNSKKGSTNIFKKTNHAPSVKTRVSFSIVFTDLFIREIRWLKKRAHISSPARSFSSKQISLADTSAPLIFTLLPAFLFSNISLELSSNMIATCRYISFHQKRPSWRGQCLRNTCIILLLTEQTSYITKTAKHNLLYINGLCGGQACSRIYMFYTLSTRKLRIKSGEKS